MSSVSAVTSAGAAPRARMNCTGVCTYALTIHGGIILLQQFPCAPPNVYYGIDNPIYQVTNTCSVRAWIHNNTGGHPTCVSPHSSKAGTGRFGTATNVQVTNNQSNCTT
jgi:hypothetical protein